MRLLWGDFKPLAFRLLSASEGTLAQSRTVVMAFCPTKAVWLTKLICKYNIINTRKGSRMRVPFIVWMLALGLFLAPSAHACSCARSCHAPDSEPDSYGKREEAYAFSYILSAEVLAVWEVPPENSTDIHGLLRPSYQVMLRPIEISKGAPRNWLLVRSAGQCGLPLEVGSRQFVAAEHGFGGHLYAHKCVNHCAWELGKFDDLTPIE